MINTGLGLGCRMIWRHRRNGLSDNEFMKRYKLSKSGFARLCHKLRPYVGTKRNNKHARNSSGSGITTEICLSMTLRYLSGGSFLDIIDMHGVGKSTFYRLLWATVEGINKVINMDGIPTKNHSALAKLSAGFERLNSGALVGCVGAIDGIAIEIFKPTPWDTFFPKQFMNRKGFFSINCQAICDANLRFTWCSLKSPGMFVIMPSIWCCIYPILLLMHIVLCLLIRRNT